MAPVYLTAAFSAPPNSNPGSPAELDSRFDEYAPDFHDAVISLAFELSSIVSLNNIVHNAAT